jgi:hypothetical protein
VVLERGPISLVSTIEELLLEKVAALVQKTENTPIGISCADYATHFYPQELALTSSTSGGRSVGIVHSWTQATEVFNCLFPEAYAVYTELPILSSFSWLSQHSASRDSVVLIGIAYGLDGRGLGVRVQIAWPCYRRRSTIPPTWESGVEVLAHFFRVKWGCAVLLKVNASFLVTTNTTLGTFADDTVILSVNEDSRRAASDLQYHLTTLQTWFEK